MKLSYYHKALIVAAVGIFYTNVPRYVYTNYGMSTLAAPKQWLILFCFLSLPLLVLRKTAWNALKSPITIWCLGYACLTVVWFYPSSQSEIVWQEVRSRFLAIVQILVFLMIFLEPNAVRLARKTLVIAILIGMALNVYEVFYPMSFSSVLGRSAGLYINPTMAGEAMVMGMVLSATVLPPRYRASFILLIGIGILTTLTRSAILAWMVSVAGLLFIRRLSIRDLLMSGTVGLVLFILVLLPRWDQLLTTWERSGTVNENVQERLAWFTDPFGVSDFSSWERKYIAQRAWNKISDHPVVGSGTGSSSEVSIPPHNQYLSFMQDHGVIGIMILPLLMLSATWGARGEKRYVAIVFGCTVMMLGLFTHTILYDTYAIILVSLTAAWSVTGLPKSAEAGVTGSLRLVHLPGH